VKRNLFVEAAPGDLIIHWDDSVVALLAAMLITRHSPSQQNKANPLHAQNAVA